jgi:hypothetical protein
MGVYSGGLWLAEGVAGGNGLVLAFLSFFGFLEVRRSLAPLKF